MANNQQPQLSEIEKATQIYESMGQNTGLSGSVNTDPGTSGYGYSINRTGSTPQGFVGSYSTPRGNLITIGSPPANVSGGGGGTQRKASGGSGYRSGVSYGGSTYTGPTMEKPVLKDVGDLDLPDYTPPEYDEKLERRLRSEYMAPGMSQVRRATSQAVISSKSIDNPNARALFINQALEGVGTATAKIAGSAGKEATAESHRRYSDELTKYDKGWKVLADETKANWDKDWFQAMQEYEMGLKLFEQQPYVDQVSAYNDMTGTRPW
jgi:hypothetical protein